MIAPLPPDEESRLRALQSYAAFETEPEEGFDRVARLVARVLNVPIALVSLVGEDRQWFKACVGLPGVRETSRDVAFCAHTILRDDLLVVPDATKDSRFADNPLVTGKPGIRFYLGCPLRTPGGQNVGTLCVIDTEPRQPNDDDLRTIRELAAIAVDELELRKTIRDLETERQAMALVSADFRHLTESMQGMVFRTCPERGDGFEYDYVSSGSFELLGLQPEEFTEHSLSLLRLMSPAVAAEAVRSIEQAAVERRSWEWEGPVGRVDGERRWLRALARPEFDQGEVVRWRGIFVDSTEVREREEALTAARRDAERAITSRSAILGRLAYEFRPPLAAVLGAARSRADTASDLESREEIVRIEAAGKRLLALVDETLELAISERGGVSRRVLAVEGDHAHAQVIWRLLEARPNVALETVTSARGALSCLNAALPDLLLVDAHLPEDAAEDLIAWVRRHPNGRRLPVILMSAEPASRGNRRLLDLGAWGILTKPIEVDAFLRLVDEAQAPRRAA